MTTQGFTLTDQDGKTHRYGVLAESKGEHGYPVFWYPDGGVTLADNHPWVTVVNHGPATYGHTTAYWDGPIEKVSP